MRVLFAGSPEAALPCLQALLDTPAEVVGVLSQPAKPVGRKKILTDTAVSRFAKGLDLPLLTPDSSEEIVQAVRQWRPDVAVVVAYGRFLPRAVRESVPGGWWNVHFSLLPRWRGAAPVAHAILAGDTLTGVTVFRIDEGLDTGDIAHTQDYPLPSGASASEVLTTLSHRAVEPMKQLVAELEAGSVQTSPQKGEPSFAPKPGPTFGLMEWNLPAPTLYQRFLASTTEPGAYTLRADTLHRLNILGLALAPDHRLLAPGELDMVEGEVFVGTATHPLRLGTLQPSGKSMMPAIDWFRGVPQGVTLGN
jgi:methionyl-tRNA formyltransferase